MQDMRVFFGGMLAAVMVIAGCASNPGTRTPMPVLRYPAEAGPRKPETLVILLPGRKDRAEVFARERLVEALRQKAPAAAVIATDAHSGYYTRGSLVRQLHTEIIEPARKQGFRRIILVGVSLGGYGAIRYAMTHREVTDVVLLSPFLGAGPFMRELAEAGDEDFGQTWEWLRRYPKDKSPAERAAAGYPRLLLGYGEEDLFLLSDKQLRELLPADDVVTTGGAHVWGTWHALLIKLLEKGLISDGPTASPSAGGE